MNQARRLRRGLPSFSLGTSHASLCRCQCHLSASSSTSPRKNAVLASITRACVTCPHCRFGDDHVRACPTRERPCIFQAYNQAEHTAYVHSGTDVTNAPGLSATAERIAQTFSDHLSVQNNLPTRCFGALRNDFPQVWRMPCAVLVDIPERCRMCSGSLE